MPIDYMIQYPCHPRDALGTNGIIQRLKGRERANRIIRLFREQGDNRPVSEMGFELTRNPFEGEAETKIVNVQDLLDEAEELEPLASYCEECPANIHRRPFGCAGTINYPISGAAEAWLLNRLPTPEEPLVWLLLKQGVERFQYNGESIRQLRKRSEPYFEDKYAAARHLGGLTITANQVFEMIFVIKDQVIYPNHAGILLLFYHIINRDMEADAIMKIAPAPPDALERHPCLIEMAETDDAAIIDLKRFFQTLYTAWRLHAPLFVDA